MVVSAVLVVGLTSSALAWDQESWAEYFERSDTITLGAGDAPEMNARIHTIDPWPAYVGNRRIPGDGERMSGAVQRYRDVTKLRQAPKPIEPIFDTNNSTSGGSGGGSGSGGNSH
jgi:hypothetical protein